MPRKAGQSTPGCGARDGPPACWAPTATERSAPVAIETETIESFIMASSQTEQLQERPFGSCCSSIDPPQLRMNAARITLCRDRVALHGDLIARFPPAVRGAVHVRADFVSMIGIEAVVGERELQWWAAARMRITGNLQPADLARRGIGVRDVLEDDPYRRIFEGIGVIEYQLPADDVSRHMLNSGLHTGLRTGRRRS